ncbi:DnaJ domain-containing protein [Pseudomassariella vexata]|uniref:DnaJ domain-containing protein n=1 Tax=Pseudomassariella vexata TaxID=1141098 RepID=A0A1Y2EDW9_9PEZI|nr:DnaJ domain-containing protein [Pseudomassariella vexata]ORY69769.1 DnaJ domain-containing protein [Pseudomassariella vexata]
MSSDYSYDDQGQFYPFFIFTLATIVTVPLTYSLLRPSKDADALAPRTKTDFKAEHQDLVDKQRAAQKRKQRKVKRFVAVLIGWALMGFMLYLIITTQRTVAKIWNPYDILGITESATEKQIKTHYKKLSVRLHPDKARPDPAKNETVESLNDKYVEITKAYQALTDEEVRNNYIQFGHPDGKQSFSIGIALPKFIISDGNGTYVVLVYALLLGVLLPYLVGSWWYGTQRMSKEGVLIESANNLFREYNDTIDEGGLITALSTGKEFEEQLKGDKAESGLAKIESRILAAGELSPFAGGLHVKDKIKLENLDSGVRRKVLALLWAYLGRVELDDPALNSAKYMVAPIAHALTQSFTAISLAYGNTVPILTSYFTSQRLIQALPPKASPLFQLPHFTPAVVKAIEGDSKIHTSVQQFMDQPDARRRSLVVGKGLLTESQYKEALAVARQLPQLRVAKAFFKVTGEKFIIPSSLVSLVIKGRFIPPGSVDAPPVNLDDLEDVDPAEDDLNALKKGDTKPILPPIAYAPRFARDHSPRWFVFLTDSKQGKMAVPPFTFATFEKPIFTEDGKPTCNMQTLKAQFAAPPGPGHYTFVMHVICDSYVGFDTKMEVTLVVEDASKAAAMDAEDEISEPDEDSIAGQMNALKTGSLPRTAKPKKRKDDSSDEESATDEEEDDTSDTNTDTEDEDGGK